MPAASLGNALLFEAFFTCYINTDKKYETGWVGSGSEPSLTTGEKQRSQLAR